MVIASHLLRSKDLPRSWVVCEVLCLRNQSHRRRERPRTSLSRLGQHRTQSMSALLRSCRSSTCRTSSTGPVHCLFSASACSARLLAALDSLVAAPWQVVQGWTDCLSCGRSKQELDVLATVNTKLTAESAHSKADLHDINEYLCNQLKATALTNATLSSRIDDLEHRLLETSRAHTVSAARSSCQQQCGLLRRQQPIVSCNAG